MTTSNTHIRIKRSSANSTPGVLQAGELAYSYLSNTAFIGTADGTGVLTLGGAAYTAKIDAATDAATANTLVLRDAQGSFSANEITANNIFVETGNVRARIIYADEYHGALTTPTGVEEGTWGSATQVPVLDIAANGLITHVSTANISTTLGFSDGTNTETLNLIDGTLSVLASNGITSTVTANTISLTTDDTVLRSNTEGGPQHISTDLQVSGNLTVQGTTTYVQTAINQTDDSMIELAANNTVGDVVDIGFYGKHEGVDGTVLTGLVRNAGSSDYYLFDNIGLGDQTDLTSNLITQGSMSANGASLYAKQFLGADIGTDGGFGFNTGGGITGMFSPADGELNFYAAGSKTYSSNNGSFNVSTYAQFDNTVRVTGGNSVLMNNGDNTDNIYIANYGTASNSNLIFGDNNLEQNIFGIETHTSNNATQLTLWNSTDIRDYETGESVIVKGEQKYGVVTQFLVNGTDPVTQKEIIDPLVPPAIRDMDAVDLGNSYDDTFVEVVFPWDVTFNGTTFGPTGAEGGIYVGSNGYLTFGSGSGNNQHNYPPVATNPGLPAIVVGLGDISYQRVYTHDDGNGHFRVRYEGSNFFDGQHVGGSSSLIWEVVFYRDVPGKFDVRIIRMNGTANDGTDGRWNTYITDGSDFLDVRADRTIPWTTYTQFAKQLTNGTNTLELLDDGTVKMPNGTVLSDSESGLFVDSLREDGTSSDIVYYNTTTKELTYGTLADIRADVLSNGAFAWTISGDDGSLTSNVGTQIAASANSVVIGPWDTVDVTNANSGRVALGIYAGSITQSTDAIAIGNSAGFNNQAQGAVAIGSGAGNVAQGFKSVAIGQGAGGTNQGGWSTAIGLNAASTGQGTSSVAIGHRAGSDNQGSHSVAVGVNAGQNGQGVYATAIGHRAGYGSTAPQGDYSLALGYAAGLDSQAPYSIALNASTDALNPVNSGLYINPIRYVETQDTTYDGIAFYNASTKEMTYSYILDGGDF